MGAGEAGGGVGGAGMVDRDRRGNEGENGVEEEEAECSVGALEVDTSSRSRKTALELERIA